MYIKEWTNITEPITSYFSLVHQRKNVQKRKHSSTFCVKVWQIPWKFSNLTRFWNPLINRLRTLKWHFCFVRPGHVVLLKRHDSSYRLCTQWFLNTKTISCIHRNWFIRISGIHVINEGDILRLTSTFQPTVWPTISELKEETHRYEKILRKRVKWNTFHGMMSTRLCLTL